MEIVIEQVEDLAESKPKSKVKFIEPVKTPKLPSYMKPTYKQKAGIGKKKSGMKKKSRYQPRNLKNKMNINGRNKSRGVLKKSPSRSRGINRVKKVKSVLKKSTHLPKINNRSARKNSYNSTQGSMSQRKNSSLKVSPKEESRAKPGRRTHFG
jgi:hypothetical protein